VALTLRHRIKSYPQTQFQRVEGKSKPSNSTNLSVGEMRRAIESTAVAKPPEPTEPFYLAKYVPQKVNVDEVQTREYQ
jgi:hypothetical protein